MRPTRMQCCTKCFLPAVPLPLPQGIIHVVDNVLLPEDPAVAGVWYPSPIAYLANSPDYGTLLLAIKAAGMEAELSNPSTNATYFVPTDAVGACFSSVTSCMVIRGNVSQPMGSAVFFRGRGAAVSSRMPCASHSSVFSHQW